MRTCDASVDALRSRLSRSSSWRAFAGGLDLCGDGMVM